MPYEYISAEPTIQTLGDDVRDAQRITIRALPSGTVISSLFAPWPSTIWTPQAIIDSLNGVSDLVATWLATNGVTGVAQTQSIDDLNQLTERYLVAIRSSSGKSSAVANLSEAQMNPQTFQATVNNYIAELNDQEAGGTIMANGLPILQFPTGEPAA